MKKLLLRWLGTKPCSTPACGYKKGMTTSGPADIVLIGKFVREVCQRCGSNKGVSKDDLKRLGL